MNKSTKLKWSKEFKSDNFNFLLLTIKNDSHEFSKYKIPSDQNKIIRFHKKEKNRKILDIIFLDQPSDVSDEEYLCMEFKQFIQSSEMEEKYVSLQPVHIQKYVDR